MTRRKRTTEYAGNSAGFTAKQMRRRKPINSELLLDIEPLTENQKRLFSSYDNGKHIVAHGVAGSGKSFSLLYKALKEVLDEISPYEKIYILRSLVQTRDIGFLPGNYSDKTELFEIPYKNMVKRMFHSSETDFDMLYGNLKSQDTIIFDSTSFLRGTTFDNCILIVDEFSNMNAHELDSVITRVGENCRIMFAGDAEQTDLIRRNERTGIHDFMQILRLIDSFDIIEFGVEDIVRSGLVRQYILAKRELGISML